MLRQFFQCAALVALASAPALAQPSYSGVYFFGTSELDTGNWLADSDLMGSPLAPTADKGYWNGRWQSGPAWSDYFAEALGFSATPSMVGGNNYAYGYGWLGPLAGEAPPAPGTLRAQTELYFGSQVSAAIAANPMGLPPDALNVISIGSNDPVVFGRTAAQAGAVASVAVAEIQRLVDKGARNFLVQTLGGTDAYVTTYNQTLLAGLGDISGISVSVVDTRTFNQTVVLAPGFLEGIGITSFGRCVDDPVCLAAAIEAAEKGQPYLESQYFSFDNVHRDTKLAKALADYAITRLQVTVPEPGTISLLAVGLVGLVFVGRKRR